MSKPVQNTGTTNTTPGSIVACAVKATRRVRYWLESGLWPNPLDSERKLVNIPYALAVNGQVKPEFRLRHSTFNHRTYIEAWVEPGQTVTLYLNSDAWVQYRQFPVFAITPRERHVDVIIDEKRGQLGHKDTPAFEATHQERANGCNLTVDKCKVVLSGDTWMHVSHKYTEAEAETLMDAQVPPRIRQAVKAIYAGKVDGFFTVPGDTDKSELRVQVETANNPSANVSNFNNSRDGLPRVHPNAWVALIEAAEATGVRQVVTSSAWRPNLGSVLHRSGLALDVSYLDKLHVNRASLSTHNGNNPRAGKNVSESEAALYRSYREAENDAKDAKQKLDAAEAARKRAMAAAKQPGTPEEVLARQEAVIKAGAEVKRLTTMRDAKARAEADAKRAWERQLEVDEPTTMKSYRGSLLKCRCVSAIFDPWYMEKNARDQEPPEPNTMRSGNEGLHKDHLHITVLDKVPSP